MGLLKTLSTRLPLPWQEPLRRNYHALKTEIPLIRAFIFDWLIFRKNSGVLGCTKHGAIEARIIKASHQIEKGLALSAPRPGFGQQAIDLLLRDLSAYLRMYGPAMCTLAAVDCLREYLQFNREHGLDVRDLEAKVDALESAPPIDELHIRTGGTIPTTRVDIAAVAEIDLSAFFSSRYSIRQFSPRPIDDALIERAVRMAQKSPSVCNRQSGLVFVITDKKKQADVLHLQNGNRGFGHQADKLLLVASRLDCFHDVGERYQSWIDGGMFAMSLIYALHSLGLGSCCLNWSVDRDQDRALKAVAGLKNEVEIVMLIAVGHIPEQLRVARSPRRPLHEVLHAI